MTSTPIYFEAPMVPRGGSENQTVAKQSGVDFDLAWADPTALAIGDGDKGDIVVDNFGTSWTIDTGVVSYNKIQDVSATDKILGRKSTGAGQVEEIDCTAAGRALLDDESAADQRTTLGLGSAATTASTDYATAGHDHSGVYQPVDADLTAIAGLSATGGYAKRTAEDTWSIATPTAADVGAVSTTVLTDTKEPTGFVDPTAVTVSYDSTERKITLTGTLSYYWRGTKVTLTSPWTSSAHDSGDGSFYLRSTDGVNFTWANSLWALSDIQVAFVIVAQSGAVKLGIRECHGLMPWNTHETLHYTVGAYLKSGGRLDGNTYTENTASDAGTTPGLLEAVISDEDLDTTIAAWTQGTYTTMRIGASSVATFDTAATFPFRSSGSYILVNTPSTGAEAATVNGRYVNVYTIMLPVTADAGSQAYRVLWLQPQAAYTSLAAAQAEDPRSLALGTLSSLSPEFTITSRITYVTAAGDSNTGKCRIATGGVSYLSGGRHSLVSVSGVTASTAGNVTVTADSTGLVTGNVQDSLENLASQFAPVAFSSLPTASENTGRLRQITDWGYPYAVVQSNGSAWEQVTRPKSTWANMLAAASWSGWVIRVTDIPASGSSEWYSNGSDWFPVGGQVVLEAADFSDPDNSGLGTLSTTSQTQANISGWSLTLPANITKGVGTILWIRGRFSRAASINAAGAKAGFIFTDISSAIPAAWMGNIPANNNGIRLDNIVSRVSNNKVQVGQSGATPVNVNQYAWNSTTQANFSGFIAYDESSSATLYPAGLVTSTSGDTIYLQSVMVILHKVPQ